MNVYLLDRLSKLDVLILTEINVDQAACQGFKLNNFSPHYLCREKRRGGGVLTFVRDDWVSERVETTFITAEVVTVSIYRQNESFTVCAVYRPPTDSIVPFCDELSTFLKKFNNNPYLILAGDFNIDVKNLFRCGSSRYLDILAEFGLENAINDYTREECLGDKITRSCIDHIIVRVSEFRTLSGVIKQKVADHYFVITTLLQEKIFESSRAEGDNIIIFDNKNVDRLIQDYDWNLLIESDHIATYMRLVETFQGIYLNSKRRKKLKKRKDKNVWIDKDIMELCYLKDKLWARCRKNPDNVLLKEELRKMRNKVTATIRLAKKKYYLKEFKDCKGNSRRIWQLTRQLSGIKAKQNVDEVIAKSFGETTYFRVLANSFNHAFIDSVQNLRTMINKNNEIPVDIGTSVNSAFLPLMTEYDLEKILSSMSLFKPAGHDLIRVRDFYCNFYKLKGVLLSILNGIFESGNIPDGMKLSIIRPVHKKGSKKELTNYRPISILPAMTHIMEKYLAKVMTSFCDKFSLILSTQYGFRKQKKTRLC